MKPASVFRRTQTAVGPVLLIHCAIILWAVTGLHLFANDFQTDHPPSAAGRPPLVFEHNPLRQPGQSFLRACAQDYTAFLTRDSAIFALGPAASPTLVRMRLIDTTPASPVDAIDGVYPTADNPHASVAALQPTASLPRAVYGQVRYRGVYPGVDLVYRDQNGLLEYDFIVAPGADPTRIRLTFNTLIVPRSGTGFQPASSVTPPNNALSHIELDPTGALILHTPAGTVRQTKPVIYQELAGNRRPVTGAFRLRGPREVGFQIGAYDPSLPLVIDPVLVYSGLLGGSADEGASSVAVDDDGNAYITGTTLSLDFPVTTGTNTTPQGGQDAYVAKFSPTGALLYCTLVGGPCEDTGNAIAVDSAGNAYITGRAGLCFATGLSPGVMVAKLSPTGSLVYLYSFGGSLADTSAGYAIAVDPDGNAYTTGTAQASSSDFPVTPGAFQTNRCGGIADGFVAKVNPAGTGLVYCTYLCGSDFDVPQAIAIDSARNAYIGGKTSSHDFPTRNAFMPIHPGGPVAEAGFVTKLSPDASTLLYSTFLGGSFAETTVTALAVNAAGYAFVTGETTGGDFPTTPGVLQPTSPFPLCLSELCSDAFVAQFTPLGSLVYSTYLAGEGHDGGAGIAPAPDGSVYVAGSTASLNFPIRDSFQSVNRGLSDVFITRLNADASRILFSSFLGGGKLTNSPSLTEGTDELGGLAFGPGPTLYLAGYTASLNFPTTPGVFQTNAIGGDCFFTLATCGDAFITRTTADGPGLIPAIHLAASPTELRPNGTVTVAWTGIPNPTPNDQINLFPLGERSDGTFLLAAYPTTGAANGILPLPLPLDLKAGAYEFRLLTPDPEFPALLKVVARSEPVYLVSPILSATLDSPANLVRLHIRGLLPGTYNIQATATLHPANWQTIGTLNITTATSAEFNEALNPANPARYYRVSF